MLRVLSIVGMLALAGPALSAEAPPYSAATYATPEAAVAHPFPMPAACAPVDGRKRCIVTPVSEGDHFRAGPWAPWSCEVREQFRFCGVRYAMPGAEDQVGEASYETAAEARRHPVATPDACLEGGVNRCIEVFAVEERADRDPRARLKKGDLRWRPGPWMPPWAVYCRDDVTDEQVVDCAAPHAVPHPPQGPAAVRGEPVGGEPAGATP
jgi:hypothetical protein